MTAELTLDGLAITRARYYAWRVVQRLTTIGARRSLRPDEVDALWCAKLLRCELGYSDLRSHELPRNSGEVAAVHGPTTLTGGDDASASDLS